MPQLALLITDATGSPDELDQCKGAVGALPRGDSGTYLFDALASYLEAVRKGDITPSPLGLSDAEAELMRTEAEENKQSEDAFYAQQAKDNALAEHYAAQGHRIGITHTIVTGQDRPMLPFLDLLTERGIFLVEGIYADHDREERKQRDAGNWPILGTHIYRTSTDKIVIILDFLDAYVLIDLESRKEWARIVKEEIRPPRSRAPSICKGVRRTAHHDRPKELLAEICETIRSFCQSDKAQQINKKALRAARNALFSCNREVCS